MHVYMHACEDINIPITHMYVSMYECMYACKYVCICIYAISMYTFRYVCRWHT